MATVRSSATPTMPPATDSTYSGVTTNDTSSRYRDHQSNVRTGFSPRQTEPSIWAAQRRHAVSPGTWANDRGGSGTATGTTSWIITGIPLQTGANLISVTAYDSAGNNAVALLTVMYTLPVTLTIEFSSSNGGLNVSWPAASAGDFVLQYADSLSRPIFWSNVVATVTTNSGSLNVTLPTTNAQRFFRLKK